MFHHHTVVICFALLYCIGFEKLLEVDMESDFANTPRKLKQDGRLARAFFSQEYKYFDRHLPTVKNETTV